MPNYTKPSIVVFRRMFIEYTLDFVNIGGFRGFRGFRFLDPPVVRWRNLHADAYRPCAKHLLGFMSIGVVDTKKNDICQKRVTLIAESVESAESTESAPM